jgi:hypothetical protein
MSTEKAASLYLLAKGFQNYELPFSLAQSSWLQNGELYRAQRTVFRGT